MYSAGVGRRQGSSRPNSLDSCSLTLISEDWEKKYIWQLIIWEPSLCFAWFAKPVAVCRSQGMDVCHSLFNLRACLTVKFLTFLTFSYILWGQKIFSKNLRLMPYVYWLGIKNLIKNSSKHRWWTKNILPLGWALHYLHINQQDISKKLLKELRMSFAGRERFNLA